VDFEGTMRTIQTFVLRLLVDGDEPHQLRGSLRSVATDEEDAFADAQDLVNLLRELVMQPAKARSKTERTNRNENAILDS